MGIAHERLVSLWYHDIAVELPRNAQLMELEISKSLISRPTRKKVLQHFSFSVLQKFLLCFLEMPSIFVTMSLFQSAIGIYRMFSTG